MTITKSDIHRVFNNFCRAFNRTDFRLDYAACYGGWRVETTAGSTPFCITRRKNAAFLDWMRDCMEAISVYQKEVEK